MDADYLSQRKSEKEDCKEETHLAALSVNKQVLLMTCKVKVIAADGSSTIVRALIDPRSSASFVHERFTQVYVYHVKIKTQERKELLAM